MKKFYETPLAVEVNIEAESMLAQSLPVIDDEYVDSSEQHSNRRRGEWGNLWK